MIDLSGDGTSCAVETLWKSSQGIVLTEVWYFDSSGIGVAQLALAFADTSSPRRTLEGDMAGYRFLLQQLLRFEIPANTPASTSVRFPLAGIAINTISVVSGTLEVIVHNKILNSGVTAHVDVANLARVSDGRLASQDAAVASAQITTGSDDKLRLLTEELTAPIGSMVGGILVFETAQSSGDGEIELEVWLTVRDA